MRLKKLFSAAFAFAMLLSMIPLETKNEAVKAATSDVEVTQTEKQVTIGNNYLERVFSTEGNKVRTIQLTNYRTTPDTVVNLGEKTEEFIIGLIRQEEIEGTPLSRDGWTATASSQNSNVIGGADGPGQNMLDGNAATIWHTNYGGGTGSQEYLHYIIFDLKKPTAFGAFSYLPRTDGGTS